MSYTPSVPNSGDSLGSTRSTINTNFQQIDVVNSVNHEAFGTADKGKHKFLQMPERLQAEIPTTAVNEGGLYVKVGTGPAEASLFYRGESNGNEYRLTVTDNSNFTTFATNTEYQAGPPSLKGGWTFLPGGLLLQYGIVTSANGYSTQTAVLFPRAFSIAPYSVTTSMIRSGTNSADVIFIVPNSLTSIDFDVLNTSSAQREFTWMAIGLA